MPMVQNESEEKRESRFLKLEDKCRISIKSNLFKLKSHYLQKSEKSVAHLDDNCYFCSKGIDVRVEYYYLVDLKLGDSVESGVVRLPSRTFFDINDAERVLRDDNPDFDKRNAVWAIGKKGVGKDTTYSVTRSGDADPIENLEVNNTSLEKTMVSYEKYLKTQYDQIVGNQTSEPRDNEEEVGDLDDLPF